MEPYDPTALIESQHHGTVNYTVGRTEKAVLLEFDVPVKWLVLTPSGARNLAADLRKMAAQLDKQETQRISIKARRIRKGRKR